MEHVDEDSAADDLRAQMGEVLGESGLECPDLPPWVADRVAAGQRSELWVPWAWRTNALVKPSWSYFGVRGDRHAGDTSGFEAVGEDFFSYAHRGHGINSYGLGLVARIGPFLIEQQVAWGGGYMDPEEARDRVNAATAAWNETLPALLAHSAGSETPTELLVHVCYSDYRGWASVGLIRPNGERVDPEVLSTDTERALEIGLAHLDVLVANDEDGDTSDDDVPRAAPPEEDTSARPPTRRQDRMRAGRAGRKTRVGRFRNWLAARIRQIG